MWSLAFAISGDTILSAPLLVAVVVCLAVGVLKLVKSSHGQSDEE